MRINRPWSSQSPEKVSRAPRRFANFLYLQFANSHSRDRQSDTLAGALFCQVNASRSTACLNNYFLPQGSDLFFFYTFPAPLSTPFPFDVEETSSLSRINFSSAPERRGFTQVIFPCQTSSQKGAPYQTEEAERWSLYNLLKARVYSRDVSPEVTAKKGKILNFLLVCRDDDEEKRRFRKSVFVLLNRLFYDSEIHSDNWVVIR